MRVDTRNGDLRIFFPSPVNPSTEQTFAFRKVEHHPVHGPFANVTMWNVSEAPPLGVYPLDGTPLGVMLNHLSQTAAHTGSWVVSKTLAGAEMVTVIQLLMNDERTAPCVSDSYKEFLDSFPSVKE